MMPSIQPPMGNRISNIFTLMAALLLTALPGNSQVNSSTEISGTVTDAAGKAIPGAKVTLVGNRSSTTADAAGKYKLTVAAAFLSPAGPAADWKRPRWDGGALYFRVSEPAQAVRIDRFTLSGAEAGKVMEARLSQGAYRVNPSLSVSKSQVYLLRIRIGDRIYNVKAPLKANGNTDSNPSATGGANDAQAAPGWVWEPAISYALESSALEKSAATSGDSLDVLAIGFEKGGRAITVLSGTQDFKLKPLQYTGILYKPGNNLTAYEKQMCTLDVHVPAGPLKKFPVIVHIHGGGLQEGDSREGWSTGNMNNFVRKVSDQGYLLICPNYRLGIDPALPNGGAPRGKWPDYLVDAAASIAWAKQHAEEYGGDTANFFVMGYSAGAWLSVMLALDTTYYKGAGMDPRGVSGYIPLSSQTYTYGEYAIEKGISDRGVSEGAALGHVRKLDIPMRIFVGSVEESISHRVSDDSDFVKKMKAAGTTNLEMFVMPGRDHQQLVSTIGNDVDTTRTLILEFLKKFTK